MSISVIISTYSKEMFSKLKKCVESISNQTLSADEIILVLDDDEELYNFYSNKFENVKVINSGGVGLSLARNVGVKNVHSDVVAFIDDDAFADPDWLLHHMKNYDDPETIGVGGKINAEWGGDRPIWFPEELDWVVGCTYKGSPNTKRKIRNPIGCNMSFLRKAVETVGYFNEEMGRYGKQLLGSEETELSIRIGNEFPDSNILYEPESIVYHDFDKKRIDIKYVIKRSFYEGVSKAALRRLLEKNNDSLTTENDYLKYVVTRSIPSRVKKIYKKENIIQLIVLIISVTSVITGYISHYGT